ANGVYTQTSIGTGLVNPQTLAVDGSGDIYITDEGNGNLYEETLVNGQYTQTTIGSAFFSVAVDGNGNLFAGKIGSVVELTLSNGQYIQTPVGGELGVPTSLATDGAGNVYAADRGANLSGTIYPIAVYKVDLTDPPSLSFATTAVGSTSTDSPQTVTLENVGNSELIFPIPNAANNPSIGGDFTLDSDSASTCPLTESSSSAPGTLPAGAMCTLPVTFAPLTSGTLNESLTLTDNSLNEVNATQSISLTGTATGSASGTASLTPSSLTFPGQLVGTAGTAETVTLTNTSASNLTLSIDSISVSSNFAETTTCGASLAQGGSCTISVAFAPTTAGDLTGTLTVQDNASTDNGQQTVALAGSADLYQPPPTSPTSESKTQPLNSTGPTQFQFDNNTHNFTVQYPAGTSFSGVNMTVTAAQTPQATFQQRVAGTPFANAICIVYEGEAGYCEDYQVNCTGTSGTSISCPSEPTPTISVKTSYDTTQSIINPGFLTAPIGTNQWENIFTAFYLQRIDPTTKGHTTGFSEFFAVDLGATDKQGAGVMQLLWPLRQEDPRAFIAGIPIPVAFRLTSIVNPRKPVTDAKAGLSVVMVSDASGNATSNTVLEAASSFRNVGGLYFYFLDTRQYAPGTYILTVYGNAFAAQEVQFTIVPRKDRKDRDED
ncbi:MAG: choice-of-anchor D domain-containing protein, partial [Terriglobales bacterium]